MSDLVQSHDDRCAVSFGAPLDRCTCDKLQTTTSDSLGSAIKLALAGFTAFSIGVAWRLGIDIALAVDGALLMTLAVVMARGGRDESDS